MAERRGRGERDPGGRVQNRRAAPGHDPGAEPADRAADAAVEGDRPRLPRLREPAEHPVHGDGVRDPARGGHRGDPAGGGPDRAPPAAGPFPSRSASRRRRRRLPEHRRRPRHVLHRGAPVPRDGLRAVLPRRSSGSWTTTAAARTGASATSRPPRRSRPATRTGSIPGRARRGSTPSGVFANEYIERVLGRRRPAAAKGRRPSPRYVGTWSTIAVALDQVERLEALAQLAGLGVAQVDAVARPRARSAAAPEQRRLDLAGALAAVELAARRQVRRRQAVVVGGAGGEVAAAEQRRDRRARAAHDRQREHRGRPQLERRVVVEERGRVEAGAGGQLRHRRLGRGQLEAAGAAAVHEPERRDLARRPSTIAARRSADVADRRVAASARITSRPERSRRAVADAGDVALVAHQPGELEARAARRSRARARPPGPACGSASASARSSPARRRSRRRGRSRCRRAAARRPPSRLLDQVEVLDGVDHHDRRARRLVDRPRGERAPAGRPSGRRAAGRRSPCSHSHRVSASVKVIRPRKPGSFSSADAISRPAAERLGRDADRLAAGAPQHVERVRPHRVEVDECERRLDRREDRLVPLVGPGGRRAFSGCHWRD